MTQPLLVHVNKHGSAPATFKSRENRNQLSGLGLSGLSLLLLITACSAGLPTARMIMQSAHNLYNSWTLKRLGSNSRMINQFQLPSMWSIIFSLMSSVAHSYTGLITSEVSNLNSFISWKYLLWSCKKLKQQVEVDTAQRWHVCRQSVARCNWRDHWQEECLS